MKLKKGDLVRCVEIYDGVDYLTDGKVYSIQASEGDDCMVFRGKKVGFYSFNIKCDLGGFIYCHTLDSSHAKWEVVNESN